MPKHLHTEVNNHWWYRMSYIKEDAYKQIVYLFTLYSTLEHYKMNKLAIATLSIS